MPLMTHYSAAQVNAGGRVVTRKAPSMKVNTADLYEEGFANPASAQTEFAVDQLTQLRLYEETLNAHPQSSTALINFVQASKEVATNLKTQFGTLWEKPKT